MSQDFTVIPDTELLVDSRTSINDNFDAVRSCYSGTAYPTSSLLIGMLCYRTDTKKLYQLKSTGPSVWILVADLDETFLSQELADDRYVRLTTAQDISGVITFSGNELIVKGATPRIKFDDTQAAHRSFWVYVDANEFSIYHDDDSDDVWDTPHPLVIKPSTESFLVFGNEVWHAGNDGPGSGLHADLLDGLQASDFIQQSGTQDITGDWTFEGDLIVSANVPQIEYVDLAGGRRFWTRANNNNFDILHDYSGSGSPNGSTPLSLLTASLEGRLFGSVIWTAANDGPASGMNADLLDSQEGAYYDNQLIKVSSASSTGGSTSITSVVSGSIGAGDGVRVISLNFAMTRSTSRVEINASIGFKLGSGSDEDPAKTVYLALIRENVVIQVKKFTLKGANAFGGASFHAIVNPGNLSTHVYEIRGAFTESNTGRTFSVNDPDPAYMSCKEVNVT